MLHNGREINQTAIDLAMMERCIALSATAIRNGEFPFASLICKGAEIVVEVTNQVARNSDVTRHAELLAVSQAQAILGRKNLSDCSIYSNVEPCVMCSFPIRETRIGRVVFAIASPKMGGLSRWNVLRDADLARAMPEAFGPAPEVISGLMRREAARVWWTWNPLIWAIIRGRGCFGPPEDDAAPCQHLEAAADRGGLLRRLLALRHDHRST
jgi:tRNA(adenine34) deaminase